MIPIHESVASFLEANHPRRAAETLVHAIATDQDRLSEIAEQTAPALARLYHDFLLEPVEEFAAILPDFLPSDQIAALLGPVAADIAAARDWPPRLEKVYNERLTRELRDATQMGDFKTAAMRTALVMHPRLPYEQRLQKARYIGGVLGAIATHQENTKKLFSVLTQNAAKLHLTGDMMTTMQSECEKVFGQVGRMGQSAQVDLRDEFTNLVVEIQRQIPGRMDMREPAPEEIAAFARIARALMSAAFRPGCADRLIDATMVLLDFYPRELSGVGARAGVQARAYQSLGFTAKKLCLVAFGHLGESPRLCQLMLDHFKGDVSEVHLRYGIEMMGAMRSSQFHSFLHSILKSGTAKAERFEVIKALGMIGEPEARDALLAALREAVSAKVIDPPRMKQALTIIESLGRLSRSPRLSERERVALTEQTIKAAPQSERRLTGAIAVEFFRQKPAPLPHHMRDWAAAQLVHGLWAGDETPAFATGGEQQSDFLGTRRDLVETLKAIGADSLPAMLEAAEQHILTYSGGAYLAFGEAVTPFADTRAIPLLEKMITFAVNMDDGAVGKYQQETYWDAAAQERKPLGKTHAIETLIFALSRIPSPEAGRALREVAALYRRGKIGAPSDTTAQILMNVEKDVIASPDGPAGSDAPPGSAQYDDADAKRAIKTLGSRGFLASKDSLRQKKIPAMMIIAEACAFEGLPLLAGHLDDKDRLTQEAALAALENFARRLAKPNHRKTFLVELVETVGDLSEPAQNKLAGVIQEFVSRDPQLTQQFTAYLETVDNPTARRILSQALLTADKEKEQQLAQMDAAQGYSPNTAGSGAAGPGGATAAGAAPQQGQNKYASELEAKRQYMLARKAWIAGGKKGPEPEKPF